MIRIAKYHSDLGKIEVLRAKDTGSLFYRQGGYFQTESDAAGVSVVPPRDIRSFVASECQRHFDDWMRGWQPGHDAGSGGCALRSSCNPLNRQVAFRLPNLTRQASLIEITLAANSAIGLAP
jgi:hypothetical protein